MVRIGVGWWWIMVHCCVVGTVLAQTVNVAINKNYAQSSRFSGFNNPPSSHAANGDTSGDFGPTNCIHTDNYVSSNKINPWWEVDLGRTYPVNNVTLWARSGSFDQLTPFNLTVDSVQCTSQNSISQRDVTVMCPGVMYGQTVRVTRIGTEIALSFCEMQVWVPSAVAQCRAGKYGSSCQQDCSDHCGQGVGKNFCHQTTGLCYDGCESGWYGDTCTMQCSPGCQSGDCTQDNGHCVPCLPNYTGDSCSECVGGAYKINGNTCVPCSANCEPAACADNTGKCQGCKDSYHGDKCNLVCSPSSCARCVQDTGVCTACKPTTHMIAPSCTECQDGYYRPNSNTFTCTECSTDCLQQLCNKTTGKCQGCRDGRYGDMCNMNCPTRCHTCDQDTGDCTQCRQGSNLKFPSCTECEDKFYKPQSSTPQCDACSSNCLSQNCDKDNGTCLGCVAGRYGAVCNISCTEHCGECGQHTGNCTQCQDGFNLTSSTCTECIAGRYGDTCSMVCPDNCHRCLRDTGVCQQCLDGFNLEQSSCTDPQKGDDDDNTGVIAGAVVGGIALLVIVIVIVVVLLRRRRGQASKSNGASNVEQPESRRTASPESPLTFTPITNTSDKQKAKPKVAVKPLAQSNTKPKASKPPPPPASNDQHVYSNVSVNPSSSASQAQTRVAVSGASSPVHETMTDDDELEMLNTDDVYANQSAFTPLPPTNIPLSSLQDQVVSKLQSGQLVTEFERMNPRKDFPTTHGEKDENRKKNRFQSILPYDPKRVVLGTEGADNSTDYINASFIKGYNMEKAYIACQGPRENTTGDFWRMVWQEKVTAIVMLTNLKEGMKTKCHGYWPEKGETINTGVIEVTGLDEQPRAHFVVRTFQISNKQESGSRMVTHYHYVKWMDHEVPTTTPLVTFWRYVTSRVPRTPSAPPLVVHCSAGVGRTGTYIALDIIIAQSQKEAEVDIYKTVDRLRDDRCFLVQNKGQYAFLHEAVLEGYMSRNSRHPVTASSSHPNAKIEDEFQRLDKMRHCLETESTSIATQPDNITKNRNPDTLPGDKHLVYITEHAKGRNQYINAVYMPTYLSPRGSIVTQLPLTDTLVDLWRLVDSWDIHTIVSIGSTAAHADSCQYWPPKTGATIRTGDYVITFDSSKSLSDSLFNYTVALKKQNTSREVRLYHLESWTRHSADSIPDLLRLLDVLLSYGKNSPSAPVLIQCLDGVSQSGALCALWDVICQMTYDNDYDVYLAARHVQSVTPHAITSLDQYRFLYQVIQQYRLSHSTYVNY